MLDFGSIFRYNEDYYVYLVETGSLIFAARILGADITRELVRTRDVKSKNPNNHTEQKPAYCFVVLTTSDFEESCAHYGVPQISSIDGVKIVAHLNEEDVENLKQEIRNDEATNIALRKAINDLFPA